MADPGVPAERGRKRAREEEPSQLAPISATGGASASSSAHPSRGSERPAKRRRLGQASVLCMRELFRAVVKDGDITEDDRLVLQNTALLLSQVDGKTWVNFSDSDGNLKDVTAPQLKLMRPFLEKVAKELKEVETLMHSVDAHSKEEVIDCLRLADVPWADGISAQELLRCCQPDEEVLVPNKFVELIISRIPTRFMIRSRVRELVNYYYLRRGASAAPSSHTNGSGEQTESSSCRRRCSCLSASLRAAAAACGAWIAPCARRCCAPVAALFKGAAMVVAWLFVAAATIVVGLFRTIWKFVPLGRQGTGSDQEPFWPAFRFFAAALLHTQSKQVFQLLILIARLRVFVCLASCNTFFGYVFFPIVVVVEKVLKLDRGNKLIGCSCYDSGEPSAVSWLPIKACDGLVCLLKLVAHIPYLDFATVPFVYYVDLLHPFLAFLFDLVFSIGIAQGLGMVVNVADQQAQQRLVWMSMGVAQRVRNSSTASVSEAPAPVALPPEAVAAPPADVAQGETAQGGSSATPVAAPMEVEAPAWSEDGTWNLFD